MRKHFQVAFRVLIFGTLLFGFFYPLTIWVVAHTFFPHKAEGSPIVLRGSLRGFEMIGQRFSSSRYFSSRPEVGVRSESSGSNLSWSSKILKERIEERLLILRKENAFSSSVPNDLFMESASGFDPHISLKGALFQVTKIAKARNLPEEKIVDLIMRNVEIRAFGLFPDRVNVVLLNQELDQYCPT